MTDTNLIEIFCIFDDFCKYFTPELKKHTLQVPSKRHRNRASRMSDCEIMTILGLFHTHRFRDLKSFYLGYICQHMRGDFPHRLSYNRFVKRQAQVTPHLLLVLQTCARWAGSTASSYILSSMTRVLSLKVCNSSFFSLFFHCFLFFSFQLLN